MGWDESKHPRQPAGSSGGGQFAPAGGAAQGLGRMAKEATMLQRDIAINRGMDLRGRGSHAGAYNKDLARDSARLSSIHSTFHGLKGPAAAYKVQVMPGSEASYGRWQAAQAAARKEKSIKRQLSAAKRRLKNAGG